MTREAYIERSFSTATLADIDRANAIIADYTELSFKLTLRQLYYQFVTREFIANTERAYKRLGGIISDGRLAGLIDWEAIEDRTRELRGNLHWANPAEILESSCDWFHVDRWEGQAYRPEVWIEKEALVGVIAQVCQELDVDYFACRGYVSQSEMWSAAERLKSRVGQGQTPVILYLGDHDPSGLDMTRDVLDRLCLFMGGLEVRRLALNMDQIEQYKPPPNPAKFTDSRIAGYVKRYGRESWELDALNPEALVGLIKSAVLDLRDEQMWTDRQVLEHQYKSELRELAETERELWMSGLK